ncbi:MAG: hypothetical protein ACU84Q_18225 [Gammaproteobacteria bacterium]
MSVRIDEQVHNLGVGGCAVLQHKDNYMQKFWLFCGTSFTVLSALYILIPSLRKPLVREDNLLEMATALIYLAVTVLATKFWLRSAKPARAWHCWIVPVLAGLGFFEEVSFPRLFFEEMPVVLGVKIDAIHDLLRVFIALVSEGNGVYIALTCGAVLLGLGLLMIFKFRKPLIDAVQHIPVRFSIICLGFVVLASILDLELVPHYFLTFMEEYLEFLAAVALLFAYRAMKVKPVAEPIPKHPSADALETI